MVNHFSIIMGLLRFLHPLVRQRRVDIQVPLVHYDDEDQQDKEADQNYSSNVDVCGVFFCYFILRRERDIKDQIISYELLEHSSVSQGGGRVVENWEIGIVDDKEVL